MKTFLLVLVMLTVLFFLRSGVCEPGPEQVPAPAREAAEAGDETSTSLQEIIETASRQPGAPFGLQVDCLDGKGYRSLRLFPGGVAVWNGKMQIQVDEAGRSGLLASLLQSGFAAMEPMYGEGGEAEEFDAAFQVSCQVTLKINGLEKHSAQHVNGPQSAELKNLSAALLDQLEPLTAAGITVADMQDALEKLANGKLALQTLSLRMVDLPANSSQSPGSILRISAGEVSRQVYTPGQAFGPLFPVPLEHNQVAELAKVLGTARFSELPGNLWSAGYIEIELAVLNQGHTVIARPFARLKDQDLGQAQRRFDDLTAWLRAFMTQP